MGLGPTTINFPGGVQDILVEKEGCRFSLEAAKPLPNFAPLFPKEDLSFLEPHIDKHLRDTVYQDVLSALRLHGFSLSFSNPFFTALEETRDEQGLDLNVHHQNRVLLDSLFELSAKKTQGIQDSTTQQFWLALLTSIEGIQLKNTVKKDEKIRRNKGREFYEKGRFGTLNEFRLHYETELARKSDYYADPTLNKELIDLFLETFGKTLSWLSQLEMDLRETLNKSLTSAPITPTKGLIKGNFVKEKVAFFSAISEIHGATPLSVHEAEFRFSQ